MTSPRHLMVAFDGGRGYNLAEIAESQMRDGMLEEYPGPITAWVTGLDLLRTALEHGWDLRGPSREAITGKAFSLWLATLALNATKIALDHTLGGSYWAAFAGERMVLEVAMGLRAIAVDPTHAEDWFDSPKRPGMHQESPKTYEMVDIVVKAAKAAPEDESLQEAAATMRSMEAVWRQLGAGAHPTILSVKHLLEPSVSGHHFFPKFDQWQSSAALRDGLVTLSALLETVRDLRLSGYRDGQDDDREAWNRATVRWSHVAKAHIKDLERFMAALPPSAVDLAGRADKASDGG